MSTPAPASTGAPTVAAPAPAAETTAPAPTPSKSAKEKYSDWPQKNDDRAQPWNHSEAGVSREDLDDLHDHPGAPNTVSPIVIGHSMPILTSGSGGEDGWAVRDLARRLAILGHTTDVGTVRNPYAVVTPDIMSSVERFREEHNVEEDPSAFGGNTAAGRARAASHVGPWTWEALIRASEAELGK